jgi:hypothetical protein
MPIRSPRILPWFVALGVVVASLLAAPSLCAQVPAGEKSGQDQTYFGRNLANAGDVDADGIDDLLVGEKDYTGRTVKQGRVCVYSGATFSLIRSQLGSQGNSEFGSAIAGLGDLNSDHHGDYAVGAIQFDSNGLLANGRVTVFSGKDGSVLWTVDGTHNSQFLGSCIVGIDDVDGDQKPEVLIGDWYNSTAYVYGSGGTLINTLYGAVGSRFGMAATACGDLDGDGTRDLFVGAPNYYDPAAAWCGAIYAISAKTGAELYLVKGQAYDHLGGPLASVGDLDGDGISDLLIGTPSESSIGINRGGVIVMSGVDGSTIRTHDGDKDYDLLGLSVAGMGDLDHDGVVDYAAGAPDGGLYQQGLVRVWSGATGSPIYEWQGTTTGFTNHNDLGISLAAGDFNADGIADLVLGDWKYMKYDIASSTWKQPGGAFVYLGCPAWNENYGAGWPGKNGIPAISALTQPVPGTDLMIYIDGSPGVATTGLLFVGFSDANIPTGKGGTILVDPLLTVVFPVGSIGTILSGHLPDDPALYFLDLYLQAIEVDAFASKGLSFTPGLHLRLGYDLP